MGPKIWWKLTYCICGVLELVYILGGKGGHGNPPEDLWNLLSWPQNAQRVGKVPGRSQEQRSPQTGPGNWNVKRLSVSRQVHVRSSFEIVSRWLSSLFKGTSFSAVSICLKFVKMWFDCRLSVIRDISEQCENILHLQQCSYIFWLKKQTTRKAYWF